MVMTQDQKVSRRLASFGLTTKDLTKEELARARRDVSRIGTGGFFSSEELIRKTLKRR